jgi:hypothetical protein
VYKQTKRLTLSALAIALIACSLVLIKPTFLSAYSQSSINTSSIVPLISTRGHLDRELGVLIKGHNESDYSSFNVPGLQSGICPDEIVIIIHGWGQNEIQAKERFDRVTMSLKHNNYNFPIIGFSWDADTTAQQVKAGWTVANLIAKENGPKLAKFIIDFMNKCTAESNSKVRIVAHSLGSRVVLSSLDSLHNNKDWNKNFTLTSVHLMGAAVDNEEIAMEPSYIVGNVAIVNNTLEWYDVYGIKSTYGNVIGNEVSKFYNLFDPKDKTLSQVYGNIEHDNALGLNGAQLNVTRPSNYDQIDVQNQIVPLCDADGDNKADWPLQKGAKIETGDNHAGYFGFINATTKQLESDGAMDIVVSNWNGTTVKGTQQSTSSKVCNSTY